MINYTRMYNIKERGVEKKTATMETLNEPSFNIDVARRISKRFSYRNINEWESKGLISPYRATKGIGWRKFSAIDMVKLFIISDLKTFGFTNDEINRILNRISPVKKQGSYTIKSLGYFVRESLSSKTQLLLFILDRTTPRFIKEDDNWKELLLYIKSRKSPTVVLPLADYVVRLADGKIVCCEAKEKA